MDELKTINDLRKHRIDTGCYKNIDSDMSLGQALDIADGCTIHDLKQSAIKWIKNFEMEMEPLPLLKPQFFGKNKALFNIPKERHIIEIGDVELRCNDDTYTKIKIALVSWIKHRYNIIDEDLNGGVLDG